MDQYHLAMRLYSSKKAHLKYSIASNNQQRHFSQKSIELSKLSDDQYNKTKNNMLHNYLIHNKSIDEMSKSVYRENCNQGQFYNQSFIKQPLTHANKRQISLAKIYRQETIINHLNGQRKRQQRQIKNSKGIFNDTLIKKSQQFIISKTINLLPKIQKIEQDKKDVRFVDKQIGNSQNCAKFLTISHIQNPETKQCLLKNKLADLMQKKKKKKIVDKYQPQFQQEKQKIVIEQLKLRRQIQKQEIKSKQCQRKYKSLEISVLRQNEQMQKKALARQTGILKRYYPYKDNLLNSSVNKRTRQSRNCYSPWNNFRQSKDRWVLQY